MPLKLDFILSQIIEDVKKEVKQKHGVDLTTEQILKIEESQAREITQMMEDRVSPIKVDFLGKLVIKDGVVDMREAKKKANDSGLTGEAKADFLRKEKQDYIDNKEYAKTIKRGIQ